MNFLDLREPVSTWSHFAGLFLALPGTVLLWQRSGSDSTKRLSMLVYGVTLAFCYLASTLYHGVLLPPAEIATFARLDSVGIFGLIAGSYTPIACCLLQGSWRRGTLAIVWLVAATATVLILTGRNFSPVLSTSLYLGMGWGVVACYYKFVPAHNAMPRTRHHWGRVIQRWRRPEPHSLARPFTWDLRSTRAIPFFCTDGKPAPHYLFILQVVAPFAGPP